MNGCILGVIVSSHITCKIVFLEKHYEPLLHIHNPARAKFFSILSLFFLRFLGGVFTVVKCGVLVGAKFYR